MKFLTPIAIAFSMAVLCQAAETFTDSRDGHKYAVVEIAIKQCLPGLNIKVNPSSGFLTE